MSSIYKRVCSISKDKNDPRYKSLNPMQKQKKNKQTEYYTILDQKCLQIPNDDKRIIRKAISQFDESIVSLMQKYRKVNDTKDLQIFLRKYIQKQKMKNMTNSQTNLQLKYPLRMMLLKHSSITSFNHKKMCQSHVDIVNNTISNSRQTTMGMSESNTILVSSNNDKKQQNKEMKGISLNIQKHKFVQDHDNKKKQLSNKKISNNSSVRKNIFFDKGNSAKVNVESKFDNNQTQQLNSNFKKGTIASQSSAVSHRQKSLQIDIKLSSFDLKQKHNENQIQSQKASPRFRRISQRQKLSSAVQKPPKKSETDNPISQSIMRLNQAVLKVQGIQSRNNINESLINAQLSINSNACQQTSTISSEVKIRYNGLKGSRQNEGVSSNCLQEEFYQEIQENENAQKSQLKDLSSKQNTNIYENEIPQRQLNKIQKSLEIGLESKQLKNLFMKKSKNYKNRQVLDAEQQVRIKKIEENENKNKLIKLNNNENSLQKQSFQLKCIRTIQQSQKAQNSMQNSGIKMSKYLRSPYEHLASIASNISIDTEEKFSKQQSFIKSLSQMNRLFQTDSLIKSVKRQKSRESRSFRFSERIQQIATSNVSEIQNNRKELYVHKQNDSQSDMKKANMKFKINLPTNQNCYNGQSSKSTRTAINTNSHRILTQTNTFTARNNPMEIGKSPYSRNQPLHQIQQKKDHYWANKQNIRKSLFRQSFINKSKIVPKNQEKAKLSFWDQIQNTINQ